MARLTIVHKQTNSIRKLLKCKKHLQMFVNEHLVQKAGALLKCIWQILSNKM